MENELIRCEVQDYIARVTLNNRFVGLHEGFFAPFEFDVTDTLRPDGENVLVVEVQNDVPTIGAEDWGIEQDGDLRRIPIVQIVRRKLEKPF